MTILEIQQALHKRAVELGLKRLGDLPTQDWREWYHEDDFTCPEEDGVYYISISDDDGDLTITVSQEGGDFWYVPINDPTAFEQFDETLKKIIGKVRWGS
jgi:hypothetical protein